MKTTQTPLPRRCYTDKQTKAESMIWIALQEVESLPADGRLSQAVILLQQAKDKVSDWVDNIDGE